MKTIEKLLMFMGALCLALPFILIWALFIGVPTILFVMFVQGCAGH